MSAARRVEVAPERLAGWVRRFTDSHGEVTWSVVPDDQGASPSVYLATAVDGSWARLTGWGPVPTPGRSDADVVPSLGPAAAWLRPPGPLLVVLVRRGGYAVAVASASGKLAASKVGTRHVQSRTAAGGWSQHRFARRRANQAGVLVEAAVGHAARVLEQGENELGQVGALVLGGDRALAAEALEGLAAGPLTRLTGPPRRELWDLSDPRRAVLDDAVRRGRAVRVEVSNARS